MHSATIRTSAPVTIGLLGLGCVLSMLAQSSTVAVLGSPEGDAAALGATAVGVLVGLAVPMVVAFVVGAWVAIGEGELGDVMGMGALGGVLAVTVVLVANLVALATGGGAIAWFLALGGMAALATAGLRPGL